MRECSCLLLVLLFGKYCFICALICLLMLAEFCGFQFSLVFASAASDVIESRRASIFEHITW